MSDIERLRSDKQRALARRALLRSLQRKTSAAFSTWRRCSVLAASHKEKDELFRDCEARVSHLRRQLSETQRVLAGRALQHLLHRKLSAGFWAWRHATSRQVKAELARACEAHESHALRLDSALTTSSKLQLELARTREELWALKGPAATAPVPAGAPGAARKMKPLFVPLRRERDA